MSLFSKVRTRSIFAAALISLLLVMAETSWSQASIKIINNFSVTTEKSAEYFSENYSDDQVWIYFFNTSGTVTYTVAGKRGGKKTVINTQSIPLNTVKDGTFTMASGATSAKVFVGLGDTSPFTGNNGPGVFDLDVPYALFEWTINGITDNCDISYEDSFSFPTQLTIYNASGAKTDQASFQNGIQAEDVINDLIAALPTSPVGPYPKASDKNYPSLGDIGWGPLVPTNASANRCIGSSKTWISGPDVDDLRSMYIYAPSLNEYLKFLQGAEPTEFGGTIKGWYIDYSGNTGYSGYLSITGSDHNYGLRIHDIRVKTNPSAENSWKADPNAGDAITGEITVKANNATVLYNGGPDNVKGPWTDGVIYSGAALIGDLGKGPVVIGTGDFADGKTYNDIIPTMLASISASMATGLLGSDLYNDKIIDSHPGSTMYWFQTMTRAESVHKLFDNAWPVEKKFYDPFWATMAELTYMQGYLSPFNDRWSNFSPDFSLGENYTIEWELGIKKNDTSTYSISGSVSGAVQSGVTISLNGAASKNTITSGDGSYSFSGLDNGTYTIIPNLDGYSFSPSNCLATIAGSNQSGKDFVAKAVTPGSFSISGNVSGAVTEKVTISLSSQYNPGADTTTITAADGTYYFHNLAESVYTVTPSLKGYTFSPGGYSVTISGSSQISKDFIAYGSKVAIGSALIIEAADIEDLPIPGEFSIKPKVFTIYDLGSKSGLKANLGVLTKISKKKPSSFIQCQWTKKIRLYNQKALNNARKQGISAAVWAIDPANQEILDMELYLMSKEIPKQYFQPVALALPVITNISSGPQTKKGQDTLIITGNWFGVKSIKIGREYITGKGAIKLQNMKIIKPNASDAAAGYKNIKGKPAFMNYKTGASKVIVIVPSKQPKGSLNDTIVLSNGVGIAPGTVPSNNN
jgi:hypothetical protein